jgi:hypothetical protein
VVYRGTETTELRIAIEVAVDQSACATSARAKNTPWQQCQPQSGAEPSKMYCAATCWDSHALTDSKLNRASAVIETSQEDNREETINGS